MCVCVCVRACVRAQRMLLKRKCWDEDGVVLAGRKMLKKGTMGARWCVSRSNSVVAVLLFVERSIRRTKSSGVAI